MTDPSLFASTSRLVPDRSSIKMRREVLPFEAVPIDTPAPASTTTTEADLYKWFRLQPIQYQGTIIQKLCEMTAAHAGRLESINHLNQML